MIAKEVKWRKTTSSFGRLVSYLVDTQGHPQRVVQVRASNLQNDQLEDDLGLQCALAEVEACQARNQRATDKTLHLVLSFHEDLDLATLQALEQRVVGELGYGAHQRISVVHGDTDHCHMHIAINKVYRAEGARRGVRYLSRHLEFGRRKLASIAMQLERDYGLVPDIHGPRLWDEPADRGPQLAALRRPLQAALAQAETWQGLQAAVSGHGCQLQPVGAHGLRLLGADGQSMAASKLGKAWARRALEQRFGPMPAAVFEKATKEALGRKAPRPPVEQSPQVLARRLKRDAGRALRRAPTWADVHAIARQHGCRLIERGGGLSFEEQASGAITSASSVCNRLSLRRAQPRLGSYQASPDQSALSQLRDTVVERASQRARAEHARRRAAIQQAVPAGMPKALWFQASQRTYAVAQRQVADLHRVGTALERKSNTAPRRASARWQPPARSSRGPASALIVFCRRTQRLLHRFPQLPADVRRKLQSPAQEFAHVPFHSPPCRLADEPRCRSAASRAPARSHPVHRLPRSPVVRAARDAALPLPDHARGRVLKR